MLNKLKEAISTKVEVTEPPKRTQIPLLNPEEARNFKKYLDDLREVMGQVSTVGKNDEPSKAALTALNDAVSLLNKVSQSTNTIRLKLSDAIDAPQVEELKKTIAKLQAQNKNLRAGDENNKDILNTLRQQTQLSTKEVKELQDKCNRLERELAQRSATINNLREEKNVLIEMHNTDTQSALPQINNLKAQLSEFDKRITLERTKLVQKDKEIESLKNRLEEERQSLEKIADELKEKELSSKRFMEKYEKSKAQVRKFKEEKTEFIKKLNLEVADLSDKLSQSQNNNTKLTAELEVCKNHVEGLEVEVSRNQNMVLELESLKKELIGMRKQLIQTTAKLDEKQTEIASLADSNEKLQTKRRNLLEALQKPVNHEIKTLQKIIRALEKLYKEYITVVFDQGNVVGFQTKITYILSNVKEIKDDLMIA